MNIRVYDQQFALVFLLDEFEEMLISENLFSTSTLTLKILFDSDAAYYLQKGFYLQVNESWYIIAYISQNFESIQVQAYSPHYILAGEITKPPEGQDYLSKYGTVDIVCKYLINQSVKHVPIETAANQYLGPSISIQSTYKNLADEITTICSSNNTGIKYTVDKHSKKFVFDTWRPRKTAFKFGPSFDNIKGYEYVISGIDTVTTVYVGGQGEGKDREIIVVGEEASGIDRREAFVDARDVKQGQTSMLQQRGQNEIFPDSISIKAEIDSNSNLRYSQDYRLGDYVHVFVPIKALTIRDGMYIPKDGYCTEYQLITNIQRHYFGGQEDISCTFGVPPEGQNTKIKKQKQQIAQLNTR